VLTGVVSDVSNRIAFRRLLTSSQIDITSTIGMARALFSCGKPPTSAKRSLSPNALNWFVQNSGVMALLAEMPSNPGGGISIFLPPCTKY